MTLRYFFPLMIFSFFMAGCAEERTAVGETGRTAQVTIRVSTDSIGRLLEINREVAESFERETGIAVEFEIGPDSSTERLAQYQRHFQGRSQSIDVYQMDVIWPGIFAQHLEDLSEVIDAEEHFPAIADIWRVEGQLVGAPYYADAPLLYHRTDLLEEYGFEEPPATWSEMVFMAGTIQRGERAKGNSGFHGFVFQGAAYEGLTCNALEWQVAATGLPFLDQDGGIHLNTPEIRSTFQTVAGWVRQISPPGVLTYMEEDSRLVFHQGNAAFMRNWPYAYAIAARDESPIRGRFDVTPLPSGEARAAATLGGWGLGVSRYSQKKEEAKKFVAYMSSHRAQRLRAIEGGYLPTRPDVFEDDEVRGAMPYFDVMRDVLDEAVARPAAQTGRSYNEISSSYYTAVHRILTGDASPERALSEAEARIERILAR